MELRMFRDAVMPAVRLVVVMSLVTGIAYPLVVTAAAQLAFAGKANGSLIRRDGEICGSSLVGQSFDEPDFFWGRPSVTPSCAYNAASSSGSNLGPTNPALRQAVLARAAALRAADPRNRNPIPVDLVTASGSGLDPHISPAAAAYQAPRVAKARGLSLEFVKRLIAGRTQGRDWLVLGEPRVNVLELNLELAKLGGRRVR
jgi:K+-transporting ATPase ATPase C chain